MIMEGCHKEAAALHYRDEGGIDSTYEQPEQQQQGGNPQESAEELAQKGAEGADLNVYSHYYTP